MAYEKPNPDDITPPWKVQTCRCAPINDCEKCDGVGWYFYNPETGAHVSDMMLDALDRHG